MRCFSAQKTTDEACTVYLSQRTNDRACTVCMNGAATVEAEKKIDRDRHQEIYRLISISPPIDQLPTPLFVNWSHVTHPPLLQFSAALPRYPISAVLSCYAFPFLLVLPPFSTCTSSFHHLYSLLSPLVLPPLSSCHPDRYRKPAWGIDTA